MSNGNGAGIVMPPGYEAAVMQRQQAEFAAKAMQTTAESNSVGVVLRFMEIAKIADDLGAPDLRDEALLHARRKFGLSNEQTAATRAEALAQAERAST